MTRSRTQSLIKKFSHSILSIILLTAIGLPVCNADPILFHAKYLAEYQGLPIKANASRELIALSNGRYRLTSTASSILVQVEETTEFTLVDEQLSPQHYQYERKGLGKNKSKSIDFDWDKQLALHDTSTSKLAIDTLDKLSYQFQLRRDVAQLMSIKETSIRTDVSTQTSPQLTYIVADQEKRKIYTFAITGEETLITPLGELRTVRVDRIRADKDRQTSLWLASDHDYLLVKLSQIEKGKGLLLNLVEFETAEAAKL